MRFPHKHVGYDDKAKAWGFEHEHYGPGPGLKGSFRRLEGDELLRALAESDHTWVDTDGLTYDFGDGGHPHPRGTP